MANKKNFRNTTWGMSKSEVRDAESATLCYEDTNVLIYEGKLVGCDASIHYRFNDDELEIGAYLIDNELDVDDITAYEKLQELMEKKYGEPDKSGLTQKYPEKKMSLETYGDYVKAIASGLAELNCIWMNEDSSIFLTCTEDTEKHNVQVHMIYRDITKLPDSSDETYDDDLENI